MNIRNIGLMLTKNEAPILREILEWNVQFIDELYVIDGSDDDNTCRILKDFSSVKWYRHECELFGKGTLPHVRDGVRQFILSEINNLPDIATWITLMHGDELFYHDPRKAIICAETTGKNCVKWFSPHFFPHSNDRKNWPELERKPINERLRWYAGNYFGCWIEDRQFKLIDGMKYDIQQHRNVLPNSPQKYEPLHAFPILCHYKVWNLDAGAYTTPERKSNSLRMTGKFGVIPYRPYNTDEFFIEKLPGFPCARQFIRDFGRIEFPFQKMEKFVFRKSEMINGAIAKFMFWILYFAYLAEKSFFRKTFKIRRFLKS